MRVSASGYIAIGSVVGVAQVGLASAVAGVVGAYLTGEFELDDMHTTSCGLSMRGSSICTAAYLAAAVTCVLSLLMIAMQCATMEGRVGLGFCGPILSSVGFFWWLSYGAAATSASMDAADWDTTLTAYRMAVVVLSWVLMCLFIASFFLSAAAAAAAARARVKLEETLAGPSAAMSHHHSIEEKLALKLGAVKRFNQPLASPPVSPSKSSIRSFGSSHYDAFSESDSPKKWAQPLSRRQKPYAVTSDGLRTLVLMGGEPVPLSCATSPAMSPAASPSQSPMARSPMARGNSALLQGSGGSGAVGVGTFSNVIMPPQTLPQVHTKRQTPTPPPQQQPVVRVQADARAQTQQQHGQQQQGKQ